MTDRPADVGRGPLTADGLCLYHTDLLPMDCTLVGRTGCVGCLLSRRNLDPGPILPVFDAAPAPGPSPPPLWDRDEA